MGDLRTDERGVEPIIMKLLAGIVLVAIGLGVGVTLYTRIGAGAGSQLDIILTVEPNSQRVSKDNVVTARATIETMTGFEGEVTLSAEGMPENVLITFSPKSGTPKFYSTIKVEVGPIAKPGEHAITVKGTSGKSKNSAPYTLIITE